MSYFKKSDKEALEGAAKSGNVETCRELLKKKLRKYKKEGPAKASQEHFTKRVGKFLMSGGYDRWCEGRYWCSKPTDVETYMKERLPQEARNRFTILKMLEADGRFPIDYVDVAVNSIVYGYKRIFEHSLKKFYDSERFVSLAALDDMDVFLKRYKHKSKWSLDPDLEEMDENHKEIRKVISGIDGDWMDFVGRGIMEYL